MKTIERNCRNVKERQKFIKECESDFEKRLDQACAACAAQKPKIIALSGPTCSGKTTAASKFVAELAKKGKDVHIVSIDDFFNERDLMKRADEMAGGVKLDYDSVNALDLDLLSQCVNDLLAKNRTVLPKYDFTTGKRSDGEMIIPSDNSIFIFEGIQAVYPEVCELFGDNYVSVSINVEDDLEFNGDVFGKRDIRLMRRLVRDYRFRGAAPDFTFYLWRSVIMNEEKSILPYEEKINIKVDSLIPYEIMLMKNELTPILELVPETSRFYVKALEYIERLKDLDPITPEMVPENSLLREFIGGGRSASAGGHQG